MIEQVRTTHSTIIFSVSFGVSGKMTPLSRVVDSSRVSSDSDPPLSSDSILIKWRRIAAMAMAGGEEEIGSWTNDNNHQIIITPGGVAVAVFVSWLVSVSSEKIMGFVLQGQTVPSYSLTHVLSSSDAISSSYLIYFIHYSSSRRLSVPSSHFSDAHRSLTISDAVSVSLSPNQTLSPLTIREYVAGVSDQRFYLLNSGL